MTATSIPSSSHDLYDDAALANPYPLYDELRAAGSVVFLERLDLYALPRYEEVYKALSDWETFSSARGVMISDEMNSLVAGRMMLCTDPPDHSVFRKIARRPLLPKQLASVTREIQSEATQLVDRLVEDGSFDAVTQLARHLPMTIVSELVGVPEEGRERMLDWASGSFNAMGPMNERTRAGMEIQEEMLDYAHNKARPPHLKPDGWAQMLFDAGERGEIAPDLCPTMIPDYLAPSLDTTIHGIANAIYLFGKNPDQWETVRRDPSLIPNAINEALRLESPVQRFTRYVTTPVAFGGVELPAESRVLVMYASANRDPAKWQNPEGFDVTRTGLSDHVAFGTGPHACIGQHLARIEMRAIFEALASRVERFEIVSATRNLNQTLRGFSEIQVRVEPAS